MAMSDEDVARARNLSVDQVRQLRSLRGTTNDAIARLTDAQIRRYLRRLTMPNLPRARQAFAAAQNRIAGADPAPGAFANALRQLQGLQEVCMRRRGSGWSKQRRHQTGLRSTVRPGTGWRGYR